MRDATDVDITYNLTQLNTPTRYAGDFDNLTYSAIEDPGVAGECLNSNIRLPDFILTVSFL